MTTASRWERILASGVVTGIAWTLTSIALLAVVGRELTTAAFGERAGPPGRTSAFFFAANLGAGVWAMWLYGAVRSGQPRRWRTAVVVGLAWWVLQTLQSAKWVVAGFLPIEVAIVPAAATLPAMVAAVAVGGWAFDHYRGVFG